MITLSKSGNTVTFTFDENSGYLQNGTIDVPVNSLSLILDESNMATFRKSASNDIFVSALVGDFGMSKSELEAWYKANMVGSTGGVTSGEVQTMIDESISGKQDTLIEGRGIDITNDTISVSLPISAGTGANSIAEGSNTQASGVCSHAEGEMTRAYGDYSHTEGSSTKAYRPYSHAEGSYTSALTEASHAEGSYTKATNKYEHASGRYNLSTSATTTFGDSGNTLFSVGNGTSNNARHNAFEIRQNGDIYLSLNGQDVKLQDQLGGGGSSYTAGDGIDITNDVISVTGKVDTSTFNTYSGSVETALSGKQDTLSAGTGIDITDNVISSIATGEQSDWNETDQNSEAFIKNKPFGGSGGWITVIYSNEDRTVDVVNGAPTVEADGVDLGMTLTLGKQYQIATMDSYQVVTPENFDYVGRDGVIVGTPRLNDTGSYTAYTYFMGGDPMMGEAFAVSKDLKTWYFQNLMNTKYGVYLLIYDIVRDPIVQIDDKYISNNIARVSAITNTSSDWNISSSGTPGYIYNRPFYEVSSSFESIEWQGYVNFPSMDVKEFSGITFSGQTLAVGNLIKIEMEDYMSGGWTELFTGHIVENNGQYPSVQENYVVTAYDNGDVQYGAWLTSNNLVNWTWHNNSSISQTLRISATGTSSTVVQLDSKYIKDDIARSSRLGGLSLVKLTQAEYDALSPNYDSNTLYVIVN